MFYSFCFFFLALVTTSPEKILQLESSNEKYPASAYTYFLEDKSALLTIEDVQKPQFREKFILNRSGSPDFGLTHSAYWGKINIQHQDDKNDWFLLFPYNVDSLDVYEIAESGKITAIKSGANLPYNERIIKYNDLLIPLNFKDKIKTIYFKATVDVFSMRVPVVILSPMGLVNYTRQNTLQHYIYVGIILAMLIYNTFILIWIRDISYVYYLAYLTSTMLLYSLGYNYFTPVFFPNSTGIIMPAVYLLGYISLFWAVMFTREFLNTRANLPRMDLFFKISTICFIPLILTWFVDHFLFLKIFYIATLLIPMTMIATGIILYKKYVYARFYTNAWLIYLIITTLYAFQFLFTRTFISGHMLEFAQAAEASLLSLALSYKMKEFKIRASHDFLTGIFNRSSLQEFLNKQVELVQKESSKKKSLSMLLLDIDHFKKINDTFGHNAGDMVLQELAKLIQTNLRIQDFFCRWGGEEFVIIAPDTSLEDAFNLGERLRELVRDHPFQVVQALTISIGVATHTEGESSRNFFHRADEALYQAKNRGRDMVVAATHEQSVPALAAKKAG